MTSKCVIYLIARQSQQAVLTVAGVSVGIFILIAVVIAVVVLVLIVAVVARSRRAKNSIRE